MDPNQSSDSVKEQEEDQMQQNRLQESFMDLCVEEKQVASNDMKYLLQLPKPIEMMFILFSFYMDDLVNIGIDQSCKIKLSLSKIKILTDISQDKIQSCRAKIQTYLNKMSYTVLDDEKKFKILYSPYFKEKAEERGFGLCKFNDLVYCHTNKMQQKQLIATMKNLFLGKFIFNVQIKSRKSKQMAIYNNYRQFIKKMREYHSKQFKDREVIVEIDNSDTKINCIGEIPRDLVAVKNLLKNLLQSTIILIIKFETQDQIDKKLQQLKLLIKKKCDFPVHAAKVQKRALTMISKQNVLKKMLQLNKVLQILKINEKTEIGMFMPRRTNYTQRKMMIEQICTKKGYDFTTLGGLYHYFKKMFIHQGEETDPKQVLSLIIEILVAIKENKQKYDVPDKYKNSKKQIKQMEITSGQYYSIGQISHDLQLTKILKRNVLRQKLRPSKPALVKYRVCEAVQSGSIYWYENDNKQKIICNVEEMKFGTQYFCGKTKTLGGEKLYFFQSKIIIA